MSRKLYTWTHQNLLETCWVCQQEDDSIQGSRSQSCAVQRHCSQCNRVSMWRQYLSGGMREELWFLCYKGALLGKYWKRWWSEDYCVQSDVPESKDLSKHQNKSVLQKAGCKTIPSNLHKFVFFFTWWIHTIYINILKNLKGLGSLDDIYYASFIKKMLWGQEAYHVFNKMDEDSKHTLIAKCLIVAKQHKFRKTNQKTMKVALEQS